MATVGFCIMQFLLLLTYDKTTCIDLDLVNTTFRIEENGMIGNRNISFVQMVM